MPSGLILLGAIPIDQSSIKGTSKKLKMVFATLSCLIFRRKADAFRTIAQTAAPSLYTAVPSAGFPSHPRSGVNIQEHDYTFIDRSLQQNLSIHTRAFTRLCEDLKNADRSDSVVTPTWEYVPYQPTPPSKRKTSVRRFSTDASDWEVPTQVDIPEDQLQITFSRSSGAGGQNVNKVNTKVELRFHLGSASWIPGEVRQRIKQNESNRINNEGFMTVTSQEYRTQAQNRKDALKKLENILINSWPRPKVRKMKKGLSAKAKERRRDMKKKISDKKANRKRVNF